MDRVLVLDLRPPAKQSHRPRVFDPSETQSGVDVDLKPVHPRVSQLAGKLATARVQAFVGVEG